MTIFRKQYISVSRVAELFVFYASLLMVIYLLWFQLIQKPALIKQIKDRDTQRMGDIKLISQALEQYYLDNGDYPKNHDYGGEDTSDWDYSSQNDFLPILESYLNGNVPKDPINDGSGDVFFDVGKGYAYAYHYYHDLEDLKIHEIVSKAPMYKIGVKLEETQEVVWIIHKVQ